MAELRIKQVKSIIGHRKYQEDNLRSLGLRRIGQTVVRADTPSVRGMIDAVRHLVTVETVEVPAVASGAESHAATVRQSGAKK
ncbi:MAG: 50S ribosomal protein L30 [Chloroflexi bacterium]|nr:50S ribosomal protein L30 [Chloroflexota bacterium]